VVGVEGPPTTATIADAVHMSSAILDSPTNDHDTSMSDSNRPGSRNRLRSPRFHPKTNESALAIWSKLTHKGGHVMGISTIGIDVLAAAALGGDRAAMERLLEAIRPLVVSYCRARLGRQDCSYASADDVAQDVCFAVLTALRSYRNQGRPFMAFVYGIASHKVADAHRSAARNKAQPVPMLPDLPDLGDQPEQRAMRGELSSWMARLMGTLPPKQRDILVLRVVLGLSAEETADAIGSTPGAVRVSQHRALNRLRKAVVSQGLADLHD
jgi:RNA polymerase sigma-70 factor, ECF subfamily